MRLNKNCHHSQRRRMSRKTAHPITKEDFEMLIEKQKEELKKYWKPRKKTYSKTGKKIREYMIAMSFAFGSGMRISEIYGLNKEQEYTYQKKGEDKPSTRIIKSDIPPLSLDMFEFNTRFIFLPKRKKGKKGRVPIPVKTLKMAGITRETLKRYLPLKHTTMRSCQRFFTKLCREVLNKHSTFHQLRHGFVTHALESGVDIHDVQNFAGHSRIDTTGQYLHSNPIRARDKYEEVF